MNVVNEAEMSRTEKVAVLLKENKRYFIIAAAALVIVLAAVGLFDYLGNQKREASILAAEDIEEALGEYFSAADEDKAAAKDALTILVEAGKAEYEGLYAHMRALAAEALVLADEEKWAEAADAYLAVGDVFADSYVAPVSLLNAAAMKEQGGDQKGAMEVLEKLVADYKDISPDVPEALFNLGRLSESAGNADKAEEYYTQISNDYGSSSWTNLAKSRIIAIKAGS